MTTAIITGIAGQDGSYLADLLSEKAYRVVGVVRPGGAHDCSRLDKLSKQIEILEADITNEHGLCTLIERVGPDEIYNLAARASSSQLFDDPVATFQQNAIAVICLLEAIRKTGPSIRFCQASSSEMFGDTAENPQNEDTPFRPRNPYGIAKVCAHWSTVNYRRAHGLFACSSVLYNHESPRRGSEFVTQKVARAAARISRGYPQPLALGDLDARRDWGYAPDYARGMWQMLQADQPDDYVLATGKSHTVRQLCEMAFTHVGLDYRDFVEQDRGTRRPPESGVLVGDATKARERLGWTCTVSFEDLVRLMVDAALQALSKRGVLN